MCIYVQLYSEQLLGKLKKQKNVCTALFIIAECVLIGFSEFRFHLQLSPVVNVFYCQWVLSRDNNGNAVSVLTSYKNVISFTEGTTKTTAWSPGYTSASMQH